MRRYVVFALVVVAFAVPLLAQQPPYEPPKEAPGWIATALSYVIGWFSPQYVVPFSAALGSVLIALIGLIRQGIAIFGGKLGPKAIYFLTAVLSLLATVGTYASDGKLAGDELSVIATTILTIVAAAFGYKLMFSGAARERCSPGWRCSCSRTSPSRTAVCSRRLRMGTRRRGFSG